MQVHFSHTVYAVASKLNTLIKGHEMTLYDKNVCLDNILVNFDHGWGGVKSRSLGQILKEFCYALRTTFLAQSSLNLLMMFILRISRST